MPLAVPFNYSFTDRVWCMCAVAGTSRTWKKNVALTEGFSKISGAPCPLLEQREAEQSDKTACPRAATKARAETITGYGNFQLLPQKHLVLLHIFDFLSSGPRGHHLHLSLPCNELICLNRTGHMRTMKGGRPRGAGGMVQKELGMICWESKLLWKSRHGRYLASSFGPRLKSENLSLPTWSNLSLLRWFAALLFYWSKME